MLKFSINKINSYEHLKENLYYYNNYFSPPLSKVPGDINKYAEKMFINANNIEIVDENKIKLGMICFYSNDVESKIGYITLLVVDKKYSNSGIGSILIKYAEDYAKKNNINKMKLEVSKNNENAIKFYKKKEYKIVEESEYSYYMEKDI